MNCSNFLDGLNGLLSGYYLFVLGSLFYLNFSYDEINMSHHELTNLIFMTLIIFFMLNIFGLIYLGDSGSYVISMIVGFILIKKVKIILLFHRIMLYCYYGIQHLKIYFL